MMRRSDAFLRRGLDHAAAAAADAAAVAAAAILPFDVLFPCPLPVVSSSPPRLCLARPSKYACNGVARTLSPHVLLYRGLPYILLPHLYSRTTFLELVYREHCGESARCVGWRGDAPRGATTHNARSDYPGTSLLRSFYNEHRTHVTSL